jgi:hypothetical protein
VASDDSTDVPASTPPASTHEFEDSAAPASEQNPNIASNASPSGAPAIYQANEAYEACEASKSTQAEISLHGKKYFLLERASML